MIGSSNQSSGWEPLFYCIVLPTFMSTEERGERERELVAAALIELQILANADTNRCGNKNDCIKLAL